MLPYRGFVGVRPKGVHKVAQHVVAKQVLLGERAKLDGGLRPRCGRSERDALQIRKVIKRGCLYVVNCAGDGEGYRVLLTKGCHQSTTWQAST